ncbi:MAG: amidohydrolase family protein [Deltaproteobacteria bacterium]|nr:amidohydrolase family protein [Deltaproteobacteria bacterium]
MRLNSTLLIALAAVLSACQTARPILVSPARPGPSPASVITNVRVFDGLHDALSAPSNVYLRDGRIEAIDPAATALREGHAGVSGEGATLLPGLIDLHVHLGGGDGGPPWDSDVPNVDAQSAALVYAGVTTILSAMRDTDGPALIARIQAGELAGPRIFVTSRGMTAPGGHPVAFYKALLPWPVSRIIIAQRVRQLATPEEARAAVDDEVAQGAQFIKALYDAIPPGAPHLALPVLKALAEESKAKGARLIVHVGRPEDAVEAAEAGASLLMHTPFEGKLTDEQVARIVTTHVPLVTTSRIPDALSEGLSGAPKLSPLELEVMPPKLLESYAKKPKDYVVPGFPPEYVNGLVQDREDLAENLRKLDAAGAVLLTGTDSGLPLVLHGAALHRELQRLVEVGFTPAHVLQMATSKPARLLDPRADFGTIEPGKRADLVLVQGDPLADIHNTEHIVAVWKDGVRLERKQQNH